MKNAIWVLLAFASCLAATPITTPIVGDVSLPTIIVFDFSGPDIDISAGIETGRNQVHECLLGFSCQVEDYAQTNNQGRGIEIPYVRGSYKEFHLGLDEPAEVRVDYGGSKYLGTETENGPASMPVGVLGRIQLGVPGTPRYVDLRLQGQGTLDVEAFVPDLSGVPDWARVGTHIGLEPRRLRFSGEVTEAPEPSTAALMVAGLLVAILAAGRSHVCRRQGSP